jgi:fructokinase
MNKERISLFGEVLFDHFPNGATVLGGAPFNVAWHLQAFDQSPRFISRIGQDFQGNAVLKAMQSWGMDISELQMDTTHPTGAVQITIEQGEPSYLILENQAYDFISAENVMSIRNYDGLLYHGTLALRNAVSRQALEKMKSQHQGKVFLDVNLRNPWWHKNEVLQWISTADWVKLNLDEFQSMQSDSGSIFAAMKKFQQTHDLEGLVVTSGKKGAHAVNINGEEVSVAPGFNVPVIDSVGAGDAFASVVILGIYLDWPLKLTMERAQSFASAIVGRQGATVKDSSFYHPFIKLWITGND